MTGRDITIAVACLIVGWVAHMLWDWFMGWLSEMTGHTRGFLWDLFACVGVVATCIAVGLAWTAYH